MYRACKLVLFHISHLLQAVITCIYNTKATGLLAMLCGTLSAHYQTRHTRVHNVIELKALEFV